MKKSNYNARGLLLDAFQLAETELAEDPEVTALADFYQNQFNLVLNNSAQRTEHNTQRLSKQQE